MVYITKQLRVMSRMPSWTPALVHLHYVNLFWSCQEASLHFLGKKEKSVFYEWCNAVMCLYFQSFSRLHKKNSHVNKNQNTYYLNVEKAKDDILKVSKGNFPGGP